MNENREHVLYRFFATDDRLLYVGITCNPGKRFERHGEKSWWSDVARIEIEHQPSRQVLKEAERRAIEEELPLHNIRMNGDEPPSPRPNGRLRRGLKMDVPYALGLDDGTCPVGLVVEADDEGVVICKFSWLTGFFDEDEWVPYDAIRRWVRAYELTPPTKGKPWPDGFWRDEACKVVWGMEPLGRFQTRWHEEHRVTVNEEQR